MQTTNFCLKETHPDTISTTMIKKWLFILFWGFISIATCYSENEPSISIGTEAPDFSVADTLGNTISLHKYKGKYVLMEFWASWCGDCRKEIPAMKAFYQDLYKKYDGKIVFLGISFDHNAVQWKNLLRKEKMPWIQASNLQPWKTNPIAQAYGLHWIPSLFLVGPDGKILASAITVAEMKTKAETIFKAQKKVLYQH